MEYRKGLLFILIAVEIILSAYLVYTSQFDTGGFCLTGTGCQTVKNSPYSSLLGVPLSWMGLIAFVVLFMAYYASYTSRASSWIPLALAVIGTAFAIYFLSLQFFVIHALCSTCLIVDFLTIIILGIMIYDFVKDKNYY